ELEAAGAREAKVLVLAVADVEASLRTVEVVRSHFPHLTIVARARDRRHAYRLLEQGVTVLERETFLASVALAGDVMRALGMRHGEVEQAQKTFKEYDRARLREQYKFADDEERLAWLAREAVDELEDLFEQDMVEPEPVPDKGRAHKSDK